VKPSPLSSFALVSVVALVSVASVAAVLLVMRRSRKGTAQGALAVQNPPERPPREVVPRPPDESL
jgi:hypothetical protein